MDDIREVLAHIQAAIGELAARIDVPPADRVELLHLIESETMRHRHNLVWDVLSAHGIGRVRS